jgi:hypothetical protein
MKNAIFCFLFLFVSISSQGQGYSKLKSCTTYKCIETWITSYENSFRQELKIASKLNNRENKRRQISQIIDKYGSVVDGNLYGPTAVWLNKILIEKDVPEEYVKVFLAKFNEAYDRCSADVSSALRTN